MPTPTLAVRNRAQQALFECELKGQISDGMWENTANTSWEQWSEAEVIVDPANLGRNFWVRKDSFLFNSRELLDVVGDRMLRIAQTAILNPTLSLDAVEQLAWQDPPTMTYGMDDLNRDLRDLRKIIKLRRR